MTRTIYRTLRRLTLTLVTCLGILLLSLTACAPQSQTAPIAGPATPGSPAPATPACEQELILPQIQEIQPAQPVPASEITVIGSGGYLQDTCGGYNESARQFTLYLDGEPVEILSCYVNRCEAKVTLPTTIPSGIHCLSAESDNCQFEFQTTK